jgi:hypothetical protein
MNWFTYLLDMISPVKDIERWNFEMILSVQSYMSIWVSVKEEEKRSFIMKGLYFLLFKWIQDGYEKNALILGQLRHLQC